MSRSIEIIPSVMPKDVLDLQEITVKLSAISKSVHVDVMDGVFVSEFSWPYTGKDELGAADRVYNTLKMGAHLMVAHPRPAAHDLIRAGFSRIIAHYESFQSDAEIHEALEVWKGSGVETGLTILADTPLEKVRQFEPFCDFFQVMTIDAVGRQGIPFSPVQLECVRQLREWYPSKPLAVDGGMSRDTVAHAVRAGATRIVVGSAIMKAPNMAASYKELQEIANTTE
jgi:ribulose-phosphate 3-epimerase